VCEEKQTVVEDYWCKHSKRWRMDKLKQNKMYHKIEEAKGREGNQDVYGTALPY
jgi:hypothetical protein